MTLRPPVLMIHSYRRNILGFSMLVQPLTDRGLPGSWQYRAIHTDETMAGAPCRNWNAIIRTDPGSTFNFDLRRLPMKLLFSRTTPTVARLVRLPRWLVSLIHHSVLISVDIIQIYLDGNGDDEAGFCKVAAVATRHSFAEKQ